MLTGGDGDGGDDVAVDADGRAEGIASDDEAGSEGRDDTRAYDANNEKIVLSSSESESEGGSDDDGDKEEDSEAKQKRDKELLAKLKSEKGRYGKRGKVKGKNEEEERACVTAPQFAHLCAKSYELASLSVLFLGYSIESLAYLSLFLSLERRRQQQRRRIGPRKWRRHWQEQEPVCADASGTRTASSGSWW